MNHLRDSRPRTRLTSDPGAGRDRRRLKGLLPVLEGLEGRVVLSTIDWNTATAPTGGSWDTASNWVGGKLPGSGDTAVIQGLTGSGIVDLDSGASDAAFALSTDSTTTLKVIDGSLTLGGGSSNFGGPVTVVQGATLNIGAGAGLATPGRPDAHRQRDAELRHRRPMDFYTYYGRRRSWSTGR